jgi:hypothetical protein
VNVPDSYRRINHVRYYNLGRTPPQALLSVAAVCDRRINILN